MALHSTWLALAFGSSGPERVSIKPTSAYDREILFNENTSVASIVVPESIPSILCSFYGTRSLLALFIEEMQDVLFGKCLTFSGIGLRFLRPSIRPAIRGSVPLAKLVGSRPGGGAPRHLSRIDGTAAAESKQPEAGQQAEQ